MKSYNKTLQHPIQKSKTFKSSQLLYLAIFLGTLNNNTITAFTSPLTPHSYSFITQQYPKCNRPFSTLPHIGIKEKSLTNTQIFYSLFDDDDYNKKSRNEDFLSTLSDKIKDFLPKAKEFIRSNTSKAIDFVQKNVLKEVKEEKQVESKREFDFDEEPIVPARVVEVIAPRTQSTGFLNRKNSLQNWMTDAKRFIEFDSDLVRVLGDPIIFGAPFRRSSSTITVNGQTISKTEMSFEVMGYYRTGIAIMTASEGSGIESLRLNVLGRWVEVDVKSTEGRNLGRNSNVKEIIDAEIVEMK